MWLLVTIMITQFRFAFGRNAHLLVAGVVEGRKIYSSKKAETSDPYGLEWNYKARRFRRARICLMPWRWWSFDWSINPTVKDITTLVVHLESVDFSFISRKLNSLAHNFTKSRYSLVSGIESIGSLVSMTPPWCLFIVVLLCFLNDFFLNY